MASRFSLNPLEVSEIAKRKTAPHGVKVYNPAFDVTDHRLITAIITEHGLIQPPFLTNIRKFFYRHATRS